MLKTLSLQLLDLVMKGSSVTAKWMFVSLSLHFCFGVKTKQVESLQQIKNLTFTVLDI